MQVTALDGRTWTVRRRWVPRHASLVRRWWQRKRSRRGDGAGWFDVATGFDLDDLWWVALAVAAIAFLVILGVPIVLALLDVVLLLVLTAGGIVARVLLRRPWTVQATTADGSVLERQVVGWRRAGDEVRALAHELQHGRGAVI